MNNIRSTMNDKYQPVIGLEVHVELNTKTKMFCRCSANYFGQKPNTHTCPVCLGLPGALPYTNKEAIGKCMQIGLALGCKVSTDSLFERKNYFYPDLAKGYQISQYRWPLCVGGEVEVKNKDGKISKVRINRAHQEEDTGKLSHRGQETYIDFNRSGVPLVEIVTEPDFTETAQIKDYAKKLQNIFQTLGVSNADMEKGDMRLEANISVRPVGQEELPPYRVELKNINSFRFMSQAVEFEIERQIKALEEGESLYQETRGWNEDKKETFLQRSKEEANDYRYFPEPDIPALVSLQSDVEKIKAHLAELPDKREQKYVSWGISPTSAATIASSFSKSIAFESAIQDLEGKDKSGFGNFFANQPDAGPRVLLKKYHDAKQTKLDQISDLTELEVIAQEAIVANEKMVADYKSGNTNAIQALLGQVMRKSAGKANPQKAKNILEKKLMVNS